MAVWFYDFIDTWLESISIQGSNQDFNDFWDDTYGEFGMGEYSYPASEILYNVDYPAYITEQKAFDESEKVAEWVESPNQA